MRFNIKNINDLRDEIKSDLKPQNKTEDIRKWYYDIIRKSKIKTKSVPLLKCKNWSLDKEGNIRHNSGHFYKVEGVRVLKSFRREVNKGWDQPMFTEPEYDGGILGLLKKNFKDLPHYLINAKFEPGNYRFIQLSPTVQATFSNIRKSHGGRNVKYLNYFNQPKKNKCKIIFKQWVSEEGGRLRNKRNLAILAEYVGNEKFKIGTDFKWVTLKQIKELILENAMVNPHLRTLVSFI